MQTAVIQVLVFDSICLTQIVYFFRGAVIKVDFYRNFTLYCCLSDQKMFRKLLKKDSDKVRCLNVIDDLDN